MKENENQQIKNLILCPESYFYIEEAKELAIQLNLEYREEKPNIREDKLLLVLGDKGLSLEGKQMSLQVDFSKMLSRIKKNNLSQELLVKASKIKEKKEKLLAIDATAGFGEDALLLAASGFHVKLYEFDPIIAALLKDGLKRAMGIPELIEIVKRMEVFAEDSIKALKNLEEKVDVIFLDPMFPTRQKSGSVKKKFQLIQQLESPCMDEIGLLNSARKAKPRKIVIKRPAKGPFLADMKPDYSIEGKAIRYDCMVIAHEKDN